ncbi:MAG TPA: MATE family efflux transporter [Steroidobacteraceae bacterium]|nr:MATE family efflux transporter [Steroidobacteraceae bacterium]
MKDLTQGPVRAALIAMSLPIAIGMLFQTAYFIVDLIFVSGISDQAIAGVGGAGNATFIILGLTQMLSVGTVALVSQAVGRKDQPGANLVFNQAVLLSLLCGIAVALAGILLTGPFMRMVSADAGSAAAGASYLYWYTPGLALQFAMVALISGLRGTGIVKPTMLVQMVTVVVNIVLAPILIAGWLTHRPLGTAGAGLASSIAVIVGVLMLWLYFVRLEHYVGFDRTVWPPRGAIIRRLLNIGLPAGGEFFMMFVILSVIYVVIRGFGSEAQAGFAVGGRVMQALFVPVLAIAFGATPVAGQNFGARRFDRVRETFTQAVILSSVLMALLTLVCQLFPEVFIHIFSTRPEVVGVAAEYLRVISWNFIASGLIFACSGLFQALGNTWPSLLSSGSRLITFVLPAVWLSTRPGFSLRQVWLLSVTTVTLQALTSYLLLRREFGRRLSAGGQAPAPPAPSEPPEPEAPPSLGA